MNEIKTQIIHKLNSIATLIRECATRVLETHDTFLMQETTLAVITHETICIVFESSGPTENTVGLVNDFGKAMFMLYDQIINYKPSTSTIKVVTQFNAKKLDKSMLN